MQQSSYIRFFVLTFFVLFLAVNQAVFSQDVSVDAAVSNPNSADGVWIDASSLPLRVADEQIQPTAYRMMMLNEAALRTLLVDAPLEFTVTQSPVILSLPLPDGSYGRFRIVESPVMAPELAAKYPEIKTYSGQGVDDPTLSTRFDLTPLGFHGLIRTQNGRVFIDPLNEQSNTLYASYYTKDYPRPTNTPYIEEIIEDDPFAQELNNNEQIQNIISSDNTQLRTFRLALAANGEYTQIFGSKANAIAQMSTSLNRVNEVYMRDLAIKLELVANNDFIVYEDPATDPYTTNYLSQNQNNLDSTIGSNNYDIGHVLTTGSGGVAGLRVVCKTGSKAFGTTGLPNPIGDPFDIDYLSHELGHQFGGTHTFNGNTANCAGGNRTGSTAYEPGSGSTIMAYAGICGAQNLQPNSDPYFHIASILQINNYLATQSCQALSGSNSSPTANAGNNFTIPQNTPFVLTGTGSDTESSTLSFAWEEYDLGPAGNFDNPFTTTAPILRTFNPSTSPTRTFPRISDILNNTQTKGEVLPQVSRTLNFKFTVRDNQSIGAFAVDEMQVTVDGASGPFRMSSLNTAVSLIAGTQENITWDVANTDTASINCSQVNIYVSADGGLTFWETAVLTQTPNDGTENITIPPIDSQTVRFKIQCSNNIFFDINNSNLTIIAQTTYFPIMFSE